MFLDLVLDQASWWNEGACVGMHPDLFFKPDRRLKDPFANGRAVCNRCPVREECLEYALENHEQHGLWGGLNLTERRAVQRQRKVFLLCPSGTSTSRSLSPRTGLPDWSPGTRSWTNLACGSPSVSSLAVTLTSSFTVPGALAFGCHSLQSFSYVTGP